MKSIASNQPQPDNQTTGGQLNELEELLAQSLFEQISKSLNPNEPLPVSNN